MGKKSGEKKKHIPKRVAGVKVPKQVRVVGDQLIEQAQSPEGRAAIARGVSVVAGAAAALVQHGAQAQAAKRDAAKPDGAAPVDKPDPLADAIGTAAEAVLGRLFAKR